MPLNETDLKRLARLARIRLEPQELASLAPQFEGILGWIQQLQAIPTQGIEPLAHALDLEQRLRPDEVTEEDGRARFQPLAPEMEQGLYLVPQVIE